MIQDIFPHKLENQYHLAEEPHSGDPVLCFHGNEILLKDGDSFPTVADFPEKTEFTYLFRVDETPCFLADADTLPDCQWINVHTLRGKALMEQYYCFAAMTGKHLADWYRDTRFCGRCGGKMHHSEKERAMVCPDCGNTVYPRIMPAVIVGVINGSKLLLTKYRVGFRHNALIAGFTEIGETLEETVAREVMEEAGVRVKNIRYYKSQPWGVANDILMGFYCDVDGSTEIRMDDQELKEAHWVEREEIELQPDNFSLTNEMMQRFKSGKRC